MIETNGAQELQFLIVMDAEAADDQVEDVLARLAEAGASGRVAPGRESTVIGAIGDHGLLGEPVARRHRRRRPRAAGLEALQARLARDRRRSSTVIQVRGRRLGGDHFGLIAGPCTVESREQTLATARAVHAAGASMLRGGAFKPRTSPYSFRGLGTEALEILAEAREETGLPVVTELLDPRHMELVAEMADVIQIGARNMQNFLLLSEVGKTDKPVLLKRGAVGVASRSC